MRLSQISDRTLEEHDLTRAEARAYARDGLLWASSRQAVAIVPDEGRARWALGPEAVERVTCSTLPEEALLQLGRRATLQRLSRGLRGASWDPVAGRLEIRFGDE